MAGFDHIRSQASAHNLIVRWGSKGQLVRAGATRDAWIAQVDFKPETRGLFLDATALLRISAKGLAIGPDPEQDTITWNGLNYRIFEPVLGPRPNGIVIFYDCGVKALGA